MLFKVFGQEATNSAGYRAQFLRQWCAVQALVHRLKCLQGLPCSLLSTLPHTGMLVRLPNGCTEQLLGWDLVPANPSMLHRHLSWHVPANRRVFAWLGHGTRGNALRPRHSEQHNAGAYASCNFQRFVRAPQSAAEVEVPWHYPFDPDRNVTGQEQWITRCFFYSCLACAHRVLYVSNIYFIEKCSSRMSTSLKNARVETDTILSWTSQTVIW